MGLMYWQIGDIWQAPTSSTIEYELKWKMGHYYVQQMYEPIYPLTILKPYLANVTDETARISIYVINELLNGAEVYLNCSFLSSETFSVRSPFAFNESFAGSAVRHVTDLPYSTVMKNAGCSNSSQCLLYCHLNNNQQVIEQTLFFTQPKNYPLHQPNLRIETIQKLTPTDLRITITATRPALFVWLDVPLNITGYFSTNGFHMFQPTRTVSFHSWTPMKDFDIRITSLFDVTQP